VCTINQTKLRPRSRLTVMLVVLVEDGIQDVFRAVHDLIKCFPSIRAPQFVILCKSLFYFEQREGLMDVRAASAFVTSMDTILFAAKLYEIKVSHLDPQRPIIPRRRGCSWKK
jgi:hypothetical protein